MTHGIFITLEGIDGTGKSTHARRLRDYLHKRGIATVLTREPGGTKVGEQIRRLLLNPKITRLSSLAELTLMYAAREQHLEEVVRPALAEAERRFSAALTRINVEDMARRAEALKWPRRTAT